MAGRLSFVLGFTAIMSPIESRLYCSKALFRDGWKFVIDAGIHCQRLLHFSKAPCHWLGKSHRQRRSSRQSIREHLVLSSTLGSSPFQVELLLHSRLRICSLRSRIRLIVLLEDRRGNSQYRPGIATPITPDDGHDLITKPPWDLSRQRPQIVSLLRSRRFC